MNNSSGVNVSEVLSQIARLVESVSARPGFTPVNRPPTATATSATTTSTSDQSRGVSIHLARPFNMLFLNYTVGVTVCWDFENIM